MVAEWERDWEFGISSELGWINSKVLLYSTGDYIQDHVIHTHTHTHTHTHKRPS